MSAIDQKTPLSGPRVARKLEFTPNTPAATNQPSKTIKPLPSIREDNEPELDGFWARVALRVVIAVREVWQWIRGCPDVGLVELKARLSALQPVDPPREKKQLPKFCVFEKLSEHKDWFFTTVNKYQQLYQLFPKKDFDQQPFSLLLHVLKPVPEVGVFRDMALSVRDRIWGPEKMRPCVHGQWRTQFLLELEQKTEIDQTLLEQLFWVQQDFTYVEFFRLWNTDGLYDALQQNIFDEVTARTAFEQNPFVALVYLTKAQAQKYFNLPSSSSASSSATDPTTSSSHRSRLGSSTPHGHRPEPPASSSTQTGVSPHLAAAQSPQ